MAPGMQIGLFIVSLLSASLSASGQFDDAGLRGRRTKRKKLTGLLDADGGSIIEQLVYYDVAVKKHAEETNEQFLNGPIDVDFPKASDGGFDKRISNGDNAYYNVDYTDFIMLMDASNRPFRCGASLIADNVAVTACHCLKQATQPAKVYVGAVCPYGVDNCGRPNARAVVTIKESICHPSYLNVGSSGQDILRHDIAILKLEKNVSDWVAEYFGPEHRHAITPAKPASSNYFSQLVANSTGYPPLHIMGFGRMLNGEYAKHLQVGDVEFVDKNSCNQNWNGQLTPDMVCAWGGRRRLKKDKKDKTETTTTTTTTKAAVTGGDKSGGLTGGDHVVDTCAGDSGGPLSYRNVNTGEKVLVGLTSFGDKSGCQVKVGVYSSIMYHLDWINSETGMDFA